MRRRGNVAGGPWPVKPSFLGLAGGSGGGSGQEPREEWGRSGAARGCAGLRAGRSEGGAREERSWIERRRVALGAGWGQVCERGHGLRLLVFSGFV